MVTDRAHIEMMREHPHEVGPRLVYADWLEERGECDHAEFIRLHVGFERTPKLPATERRLTQLLRRQKWTYADKQGRVRHGGEGWRGPYQYWWHERFPGLEGLEFDGLTKFNLELLPHCLVKNGVATSAVYPWDQWAKNADQIYEANPITSVQLTGLVGIWSATYDLKSKCYTIQVLREDNNRPPIFVSQKHFDDRGAARLTEILPDVLAARWPRVQFAVQAATTLHYRSAIDQSYPQNVNG